MVLAKARWGYYGLRKERCRDATFCVSGTAPIGCSINVVQRRDAKCCVSTLSNVIRSLGTARTSATVNFGTEYAKPAVTAFLCRPNSSFSDHEIPPRSDPFRGLVAGRCRPGPDQSQNQIQVGQRLGEVERIWRSTTRRPG